MKLIVRNYLHILTHIHRTLNGTTIRASCVSSSCRGYKVLVLQSARLGLVKKDTLLAQRILYNRKEEKSKERSVQGSKG